jgi:3-(3-hydroxy-phenyl)propionate hydroxylase
LVSAYSVPLRADEVRHRLGLMITALDIRYDTKGDHALAGCRVPDVDLATADGATRVYELLHAGRAIILSLNGNEATSVTGWHDRVDVVSAECHIRHWAIPGVGAIAAPAAVLIRPDGYAAWVSDEPSSNGGLGTGGWANRPRGPSNAADSR